MDEQTVQTSYDLTSRESTTLKIYGQLLTAAKAKVFDAQAKLQAAQAAVDEANRQVLVQQERINGSISTMIDSRGLSGTWSVDALMTKLVAA